MWLIIVLSILLFLFLVLLLAPIELIVHTEHNLYKVRNRILFAIQYRPNEDIGYFSVRILFVWFKLRPLKWMVRSRKPSKTEPHAAEMKEKPLKTTKRRPVFPLIKKLLGTIRINYLRVFLDTGDFPLNAQLVPLAAALSGQNREIAINFENDNRLELCVRHRPIHALIAVITYFIQTKKR